MKRLTMSLLITAAFAVAFSPLSEFTTAAEAAKEPPKDRVVVMYFHRTQRCPTCLKMGSYSEQAVATGFADQIKKGTVEFHYIDFQIKQNAAYAKAYKITGPALIIAKVVGGKVAEFKDLKDIWSNVADKKAFFKYVQDQVTASCAKEAPKKAPAK
jgi:hypothetical protein